MKETKIVVEILKETFSYALFLKRTELNCSQEAMAEKCCISARQYIDLEHGLYLPSFQTFINITINLGFDYNEFISEIKDKGYEPMDKN